MRHFTSLLMIAALLSVSSLPMLPQTPVCHAAEANAECSTCHTDDAIDPHAKHEEVAHMMHGKQGMEIHHQSSEHQPMQHEKSVHDHGDMNHQMESDDHQMHQQPDSMHQHKSALSTAEKECRIECGCGCNSSVDGFPQALSPHIIPVIHFETGEQITRIEPEAFPALQSTINAVPPPPPKHS